MSVVFLAPCPSLASPCAQVRALGTQAHADVASIGRQLAAAAMATRRYAVAEPLCRQALAMAQHGVGLESKEVRAGWLCQG